MKSKNKKNHTVNIIKKGIICNCVCRFVQLYIKCFVCSWKLVFDKKTNATGNRNLFQGFPNFISTQPTYRRKHVG